MAPRGFVLRIAYLVAALLTASHAWASSPDCGDNTGTKATGKPIAIGAITTMSGVASFKETDLAARAYFDCVNANGGIHGRPIEYVDLDDQGKLDIAAQAAKKLVDDDGSYILVGSTSIVECMVNAGYLARHDILEIGVGSVPQCFNSRNIAEINSGPRETAIAAADYARRVLRAKSTVCLAVKFPGTEYFCNGVAAWGKKYKVKVTSIYTDPVSPDYGSQILQIMAAGADAVVPVIAMNGGIQLLNAAEEQDAAAHTRWTTPGSFYDETFPKAIDSKYWNKRLWVNTDGDIEGTGADSKNWIAVHAAYAPAKLPAAGSYAHAGYLAARIAVRAMLTIPSPDRVNREAVTEAVRNMAPYGSDMLCSAWYWGGSGISSHNANHVSSEAVLDGGQWKSVENCFPDLDPGLAPIIALEKMRGINKQFDDEYDAAR